MKNFTSYIFMVAMLPLPACAQRIQQPLGRSVVAVTNESRQDVLVSWRRLAQEPEDCTYNIYMRSQGSSDYTKVNATPIDNTNYQTTVASIPFGTEVAVSMVSPDGVEGDISAPFLFENHSYGNVFFEIDFETELLNPNNYEFKYAWPMDTDGDGEYDAILADRRYCGLAGSDDPGCTTTSHKLQAYSMDGQCLWTVDIGPNVDIDAGHTDMVVAYDINCDGRCEVIVKSSDGTRFWDSQAGTWGSYVGGSDTGDTDGDGITDYTTQSERNPPFYISVIDGATGEEITYSELDYTAITDGEDQYSRDNRADYYDDSNGLEYAFLGAKFAICYFDGIHPSLAVQCYNRDKSTGHHYYVLEWKFDWANGQPSNWHHAYTWAMKTANSSVAEFHQLRVADVDGDGIDDLMEGGYAVNSVKGLVMSPSIGHGDRFDVSDIDPERPGLEVFAIQQSNLMGQVLYDAATGEHIKEWYLSTIGDVGRGRCIDVDSTHKGYEIFSTMGNLYDCRGDLISEGETAYPVEASWWDGDLQRELIASSGGSGRGTNVHIAKYDGTRLVQFSRESGWVVHTGSAVRPAFMGDMTGDWREELILMKQDASTSTGMIGYSTNLPTDYSFYTLQEDPHYRLDCTTRGYYQMPCTGFYLGGDMPYPPLPPTMTADLRWQGGAGWSASGSGFTSFDQTTSRSFSDGESVIFDISGDNAQDIQISGTLMPSVVYLMNPKGHDYHFAGTGTLAGDMELWKSMQGTATFDCDLTFTGRAVVSEGTLCVNGSVAGPVELRAKGTLAGTGTVNGNMVFEAALNYEGCRLMPGNDDDPYGTLAFGQSLVLPGDVYIEVQAADGQASMISVDGDLTLEGTNHITVTYSGDVLDEGTYVLAECSGELVADPSSIEVLGLSQGYSLSVEGNQLVLTVNPTRSPMQGVTWTGNESNQWNYESENFEVGGEATTFVTGDEVVFDDGATVRDITLDVTVATGGVTFDFDQGTYTFTGSGGISGSGGMTKNGQGEVRMELQNSDFTGPTVINEGTLTVTNLADGGTKSALGASSADEGNLQMAGGTLSIEATNMATDHVITLVADTSTITVASSGGTVSLKGMVTGDGYLVKDGPGQLNFTYGGTNPFAGLILKRGTVATGAWNSTFGRVGSPMVLEGGTVDLIDVNNSSTRPIFDYEVTVVEGTSSTVMGTTRGAINGSFRGTGNLTIVSDGVRNDIGADFSAFAGTLTAQGSNFRLMDNVTDMAQTNLVLDEGCVIGHYASNGSGLRAITTSIGSVASSSNDCSLGNGVDSYEVGLNNESVSFRGKLTASTVTKRGTGTWTLTGEGSTADVIVAEGLLLVNNSALSVEPVEFGSGTVEILDGGRIAGIGGVNNLVAQSGGVVSAGNGTYGTLKSTGSVTLHSGSTIEVKIGYNSYGAETNDKYHFDGDVTHDGDTILIIVDEERLLEPEEFIEVFIGDGAQTGSFVIKTVSEGQDIQWDDTPLLTEGLLRVASATGIKAVKADGDTVDVYTIDGMLVRKGVARPTALDGLASGVYIVGGRKEIKY